MKTIVVHRPPRLQVIISPRESIEIEAVPLVARRLVVSRRRALVFTCALGLFFVAGVVAMMGSTGHPTRILGGGAVCLLAGIIAFVRWVSRLRREKKVLARTRKDFLKNLKDVENRLKKSAVEQRSDALRRHPKPEALTEMIRDPYRLWERRKTDDDFLMIRLGVGVGKLAQEIKIAPIAAPIPTDLSTTASTDEKATNPQDQPTHKTKQDTAKLILDPISQAHYTRMMRQACTIDQLPIAIPMLGSVSIVGEPQLSAEMLRAIVCTTAVFHSPEDLKIHVALPCSDGQEPRWAVWLPHLLSDDYGDGPVGRRHASFDDSSATELCAEIDRRAAGIKAQSSAESRYHIQPLDCPHLLIALNIDSVHGTKILKHLESVVSYSAARITVLSTATTLATAPSRVDVQVCINPDRSFTTQFHSRGEMQTPYTYVQGYSERFLCGGNAGIMDPFPIALAETIARTLAPHCTHTPNEHYQIPPRLNPTPEKPVTTPDSDVHGIPLDLLLGVEDLATYSLEEAWTPRKEKDFLVAPLGIGDDGEPVLLDIKKHTKNGCGPHGLVVGAAGSGVSELLRTFVLSFAICHPPQQLTFMLIDAESRGTFRDLAPLPHVAAVVDDLNADETARKPQQRSLAHDRLYQALAGEVERRRETTSTPTLVVVIDDYPHLIDCYPQFATLLTAIAQDQETLNIHLLIGCKPSAYRAVSDLDVEFRYCIVMGEIDKHLRATIVPNSHEKHAHSTSGAGFVYCADAEPRALHSTYISGPYRAGDQVADTDTPSMEASYTYPPIPIPFGLRNASDAWLIRHKKMVTRTKPSHKVTRTVDVVVNRLAREPAFPLWTEPLPAVLSSGDLLKHPLCANLAPGEIPVGLYDDPYTHCHRPLFIHLGLLAPHCVVLGGKQSGKTTLLKTLMAHTEKVNTGSSFAFTVVDLAGTELEECATNPVVTRVATRNLPDTISEAITSVHEEMLARETLKAQVADASWVCQVLVIDGWDRDYLDATELTPAIIDIAMRGPQVGIQLIVTVHDWATLPQEIQLSAADMIECALTDPRKSVLSPPDESSHNNGVNAACVLNSLPRGRVFTKQGLFAQIARLDSTPPHLTTDTQPRVQEVSPPKKVSPLATIVHSRTPIMIVGAQSEEKDYWMRTILTKIVCNKNQGEVMMGIFDRAQSLAGHIPDECVGGYAGTRPGCKTLVKGLAAELARRHNEEVWSGPEILLVIHNAELIDDAENPLKVLGKYLPYAEEIHLRIIISLTAESARAHLNDLLNMYGIDTLVVSANKEVAHDLGLSLNPTGMGQPQWVPQAGEPQILTAVENDSL